MWIYPNIFVMDSFQHNSILSCLCNFSNQILLTLLTLVLDPLYKNGLILSGFCLRNVCSFVSICLLFKKNIYSLVSVCLLLKNQLQKTLQTISALQYIKGIISNYRIFIFYIYLYAMHIFQNRHIYICLYVCISLYICHTLPHIQVYNSSLYVCYTLPHIYIS